MGGFYEDWFKSPGFGPNWMHGPVGDAYWGGVGKVVDQQVSRIKLGMRARFPDDAAAMEMADALEHQGADRQLPRGGTTPGASDETLTAWAARIKGAWETWEAAGTPRGLLLQLKIHGFPMGETGASIFNHIGKRYYLDGSDALVTSDPCGYCENRTNRSGAVPTPRLQGFTLDARDQFYSHFCILFFQDVPELTNEVGNSAKAVLNQTVRRWRQGGSIYSGAAVAPQATDAKVLGWPPTMLIGDPGIVFGPNGARFIDPE